ncbi:MAG: L-seryl-tRNA(Sec) selenium transferase [Chloroflexota bacterium]|nr:MAG: L-seryl-tRNA(Sec) selenium transferase [Chloroflexota bacterium]
MQYRDLPSVEAVLADLNDIIHTYDRSWIVDLVRGQLKTARELIKSGDQNIKGHDIADGVRDSVKSLTQPVPRQIINATGVVIHTNLGRSPLSEESIESVKQAAIGYSDLELDLSSGRRGSRQAHVQKLLTQLTGAEASLVVNNNASAILLGLTALAFAKSVVVSRGEAVEIGGGFRIPDVLLQSGASLVEVGTTNRTYISDYEKAINDDTGAFLKAHASNFRVEGFTAAVEPQELVALGTKRGIPVLHDVGSGCFLNTEDYGMAHEPTPQESVRAGVGLTFFSGDKLLGGPQAGIVVGTRSLISILERHPLARAVRIDKLSLASLTMTLQHYLLNESEKKIPIWRMISASAEDIKDRANLLKEGLEVQSTVVESRSPIGGGSLPGETLPSWVLAIHCGDTAGGADRVLNNLRKCDKPVIGRIADEQVLLDPRTVLPEQDADLKRSLRLALSMQ